MRHILAAKTQDNAGDRRIIDFGKLLERRAPPRLEVVRRPSRGGARRSKLNLQLRQPVRRAAINHRAMLDLETWMFDVRCSMFDVSLRLTSVLAHRQHPAVWRLRELGDENVKLQRIAKLRRQRVRQNLQAFVEGKFWCAVFGDFAGLLAVARAKN